MLPNIFANITIPNYDAELTTLTRKWAKQAASDREARRDPVLRVAMTKLVIGLGELIEEVADMAELAATGGDAFAADEMRELLTWQLTEFLSGAQIERGDDSEVYQEARRWYQVSERHALTWFETTRIGATWEIVAVESDAQQVAEPLDAVITRMVKASPNAPIEQLVADVLAARPAPAGFDPQDIGESLHWRIEAARAQQPPVELSGLDLRELVANGLRDRNWIEDDMFCNPFNGSSAHFDADLPVLLELITDERFADDATFTLEDVIAKLIGSPVIPPVAKPGSMFEVIRSAIDEAADTDTIDDIVDAVLRVKPAPVPEWETHLRSVIRQRIEEILLQRARAGAANA